MRQRSCIVRAWLIAALVPASVGLGGDARAQGERDLDLAVDARPAPGAAPTPVDAASGTAGVPEMPPPRRGLALESAVGALGFMGDFRHIAPPGPWWRVNLGYDATTWLRGFAYGEVMFTDTSDAQAAADRVAFPIYGFGAGARGTVHVSRRVGLFLEGFVGTMRADVPHGALADLGFGDLERFGFAVGARTGVRWHLTDPHLALGLDVGARDCPSFAQVGGASLPWMLDGSASVAYAF